MAKLPIEKKRVSRELPRPRESLSLIEKQNQQNIISNPYRTLYFEYDATKKLTQPIGIVRRNSIIWLVTVTIFEPFNGNVPVINLGIASNERGVMTEVPLSFKGSFLSSDGYGVVDVVNQRLTQDLEIFYTLRLQNNTTRGSGFGLVHILDLAEI